jgi:hypothetical protein
VNRFDSVLREHSGNEWAKGAQVSENCIVVGHSNPGLLFNVIEKEQFASIPCHGKYASNLGIATSQTSLLVMLPLFR